MTAKLTNNDQVRRIVARLQKAGLTRSAAICKVAETVRVSPATVDGWILPAHSKRYRNMPDTAAELLKERMP